MYEAGAGVKDDQHNIPGGGEDQETLCLPYATIRMCRVEEYHGDSLEVRECDKTSQHARVLLRVLSSRRFMPTKMFQKLCEWNVFRSRNLLLQVRV